MIKVFWHQSSNFGDKLTPYFLEKVGIEHQYVHKGCEEDVIGQMVKIADSMSYKPNVDAFLESCPLDIRL